MSLPNDNKMKAILHTIDCEKLPPIRSGLQTVLNRDSQSRISKSLR
jgi:hypothetical protein